MTRKKLGFVRFIDRSSYSDEVVGFKFVTMCFFNIFFWVEVDWEVSFGNIKDLKTFILHIFPFHSNKPHNKNKQIVS